MGKPWSRRPFIEFVNAVDELLERRYGLTCADADLGQIAAAQEAGETPDEYVEWFGEKYELTRIDKQSTDAPSTPDEASSIKRKEKHREQM